MRKQTTTWEELNSKLDYYLSDEGDDSGDHTYTQAHRIASWNWSQRMLVWHTPRSVSMPLSVDTDERSAILPPDFLGVWRIYDSDAQRWMTPMRSPQQGSVRYDDDELSQYWVWGGKLRFERSVTINSGDIVLHYWAYWPEVEYTTDSEGEIVMTANEIVPPPWSILPLCHLTAANLLVPAAIQAARIRQWNIRVDSGNPLNNPRAQQAREHLYWWATLLAMVPPKDWRADQW